MIQWGTGERLRDEIIEGEIYNSNKYLYYSTSLLIGYLSDAVEFTGLIHLGKKKLFPPSPNDGVNFEMIKLNLLSLPYRHCSSLML
ncbi:hypothetical protein [Candidatus Enterovibrio escicola]|uniref:hypothetical protein n=2 Tax=Candidatus Enterovibrio escicola TaxID=1927127 RepID=UPI001237E3BD|nr:hypothetical protein [Candidatus Enterovibrio escacola]